MFSIRYYMNLQNLKKRFNDEMVMIYHPTETVWNYVFNSRCNLLMKVL